MELAYDEWRPLVLPMGDMRKSAKGLLLQKNGQGRASKRGIRIGAVPQDLEEAAADKGQGTETCLLLVASFFAFCSTWAMPCSLPRHTSIPIQEGFSPMLSASDDGTITAQALLSAAAGKQGMHKHVRIAPLLLRSPRPFWTSGRSCCQPATC